GRVADLLDDVAALEAGAGGGPAGLHALGVGEVDALGVVRHVELARLGGGQRFEPGDPEVAAVHAPVRLELVEDGGDGVGADGEADALGGRAVLAIGHERGDHAHNLAVHVDQRAAAVAVVHGRVRLDRAEDGGGVSHAVRLLDRAVLLADDAFANR